MPGTAARRSSIGVAPMKPVTRWRSIRSKMRGALKRSTSTISSPAMRLRVAVKPLVW